MKILLNTNRKKLTNRDSWYPEEKKKRIEGRARRNPNKTSGERSTRSRTDFTEKVSGEKMKETRKRNKGKNQRLK